MDNYGIDGRPFESKRDTPFHYGDLVEIYLPFYNKDVKRIVIKELNGLYLCSSYIEVLGFRLQTSLFASWHFVSDMKLIKPLAAKQ
jgi:hypothetical protein